MCRFSVTRDHPCVHKAAVSLAHSGLKPRPHSLSPVTKGQVPYDAHHPSPSHSLFSAWLHQPWASLHTGSSARLWCLAAGLQVCRPGIPGLHSVPRVSVCLPQFPPWPGEEAELLEGTSVPALLVGKESWMGVGSRPWAMGCLHIGTCGRCRGKDGRSYLLPLSLYEQEQLLGFPPGGLCPVDPRARSSDWFRPFLT